MSCCFIGSNPLFRKSFENFEIDTILKDTKNYKKYINMNNNKYSNMVYYRIKCLMFLGKFEEAEALCIEALTSGALTENCRYVVQHHLFLIYFHTKRYFAASHHFKIASFTNDDDYIKSVKKQLLYSLINDGNPELGEKYITVPKDWVIKHVMKKRSENFNIDPNLLLDVIIDNFDKARVYYQNSTEIRIFRCFNVGKSEYTEKTETCDFIVVCSLTSDPLSMKTFYFVPSSGSVEYADITQEVYKKSSPESSGTSHRIDRFKSRQRNMNSNLKNKK